MAILLGFYGWTTLAGVNSFNDRLQVPIYIAISAAITLVVVAISYFKTPTNKLAASAIINYTLNLATIAALVIMTGGIASTFFGWLVAMAALASYFMTGGIALSLTVAIGVLVYEYISLQTNIGEILAAGSALVIPAIGGHLLWSRLGDDEKSSETSEDRAYSELASELSEVAGKSEVVINAINDGVLALDGQGAIQLINPAAQRLIGWTRNDALKLSYKSVFKMLDTKNQPVNDTNDPISQTMREGKFIKNDSFSLETHSGKTFLASISVSPVGQLGSGVIIVFRDITAEKSDERQRAEFISTASHEMRTPVASIEGYLGLALNPATATIDAKARDFITKAHESAQHLGRLFADLLDVSKADDSRLKNDPKVVDVVPFVHDIVEGLTPKAIEKGLRMLFKPIPDGQAPTVGSGSRLNPVYYANVDNDHLREVVQNLVENAIKYTPSGDVVVDIKGDTAHIVISVTDTGIGIPHEDQGHLFQKFYRVDNSDTREIGGTGLGLYLCRRLTETIGGRIWVESEYKHGSTFFVELPRIGHNDAMRLIEASGTETTETTSVPIAPSAATPITPPVVTTPAPSHPAPQPVAPVKPPVVAGAPPVATAPASPTPAAPVLPQPITMPVATAPATIPSPTPTPVQAAPANTPISAIEANPSRYTSVRPPSANLSVPKR